MIRNLMTNMELLVQGYIFSGSDDGVVILWNITAKTKVPLNSKNKSSVKCISFSPDGEYIAAGREDGQLDFWLVKV